MLIDYHYMPMTRALFFVAAFQVLTLAGCVTNRLVKEESNPEYVGKSFKSVLVVAVTSDDIVRRTFEDRVVALLDKRGLKGIPAYSVVGGRGKVEEAQLREAIARSGAEGVLISRVTRVDQSTGYASGSTVIAGYGWGGFYGYYSGVWDVVTTPDQKITGPTWTLSETRLFDAKNGTLAWTGVVDTKENDNLGAALTDYIHLIFDAMVSARVL